MSLSFFIFLFIGMCLMFLCMWYTGRSYSFPVWKIAVSAFLLTVIGVAGAYLMAFVESGKFNGGRSFYGALFLAPVLIWPVAKVLKLPYGKLLDICAPAECIMLALLKAKCRIDGCCFGRIMTIGGNSFRFPSQIVECAAAIVLMVVLIIILKKKKWIGLIFPWYMVLYGFSRLIFNQFRETSPWIGPFAAGTFWSLISLIIGGAVIVYVKTRGKKTN